ncbi:MAG TPA: quinone-dependent dihydroorotate dehydrogenase [Myxococcota bacterium]|nr:quinone-dependent dihydroorotate dehydrogenase [Myxococcota bacterium]
MLDFGYALLKPLLFRMDAETAHERVLHSVGTWPRIARALTPDHLASSPRDLGGFEIAGPVGLAAGLDKDAEGLPLWDHLGFGFIEVGTVTRRPQLGNPRPRVHRLVEHRAVVNSMGFPSAGLDVVAARMRGHREAGLWPRVPVGANLGKNKDTPAELAHEDYAALASGLDELVDYFVVNVSSPNTPGLRDLQTAGPLTKIVEATLAATDKPVFVKLAPDLADGDLVESVEASLRAGALGIIATNTTRQRFGIASAEVLEGGLSGEPLFELAKARIQLAVEAAGEAPVIGVGGVGSPQQAQELVDLGCRAVQVLTGIIFAGPGLPHRINQVL